MDVLRCLTRCCSCLCLRNHSSSGRLLSSFPYMNYNESLGFTTLTLNSDSEREKGRLVIQVAALFVFVFSFLFTKPSL